MSSAGLTRLYTSGGGARIPGLGKALGNRLRLPVQLANPIERLQVADGVFAVAHAMAYLRLPEKEVSGGGRVLSRSRDLHVARKVLQVFPDEAADGLPNLYHSGDAITRGNVIRAARSVAGGLPVRRLLVDALDDTDFCEEQYPEISGEPLRICDVAYNQLVLRYRLKCVLRTIDTIDRLEIRDYHIGVLKEQLAQLGLTQ